jgi:hypothetical protein
LLSCSDKHPLRMYQASYEFASLLSCLPHIFIWDADLSTTKTFCGGHHGMSSAYSVSRELGAALPWPG